MYIYTHIKSDRHYERGLCYVARQNATIPLSRMEYVATNIYVSYASLSAGYGSRFFSAPLVARFQFPDRWPRGTTFVWYSSGLPQYGAFQPWSGECYFSEAENLQSYLVCVKCSGSKWRGLVATVRWLVCNPPADVIVITKILYVELLSQRGRNQPRGKSRCTKLKDL